MKAVFAIFKWFKLEEVKEALGELGSTGMTVIEVKGFGRQSGHTEVYRGSEYTVDFLPKVLCIVIEEDDRVRKTQETIIKAANTGKIGDGWTWITSVESVFRIRTHEQIIDDGLTELSPKIYQNEIAKEIEYSSEYSRMRLEIIEHLQSRNFKVDSLVTINGAKIDFEISKGSTTTYCLYRSNPTLVHVQYLNSVIEKWNEKLLLCDCMRSEIEDACEKSGIKLLLRETLLNDDSSLRLLYKPTESEVNEMIRNFVLLEQLLQAAVRRGYKESDCMNATKAIDTLMEIYGNDEYVQSPAKMKKAWEMLEGTDKTLKKFAGIGNSFSTLLKIIKPIIDIF